MLMSTPLVVFLSSWRLSPSNIILHISIESGAQTALTAELMQLQVLLQRRGVHWADGEEKGISRCSYLPLLSLLSI